MNHIIRTWQRSDGRKLHLFLRDTGRRVSFSIGDATNRSHDYEEFVTYRQKPELPEGDWVTQKKHLLEHKIRKLADEVDAGLALWCSLNRDISWARHTEEEIAGTRALAQKNPAEHSIIDGHAISQIGPPRMFSKAGPVYLCNMLGHMCITPFPLLQVVRFFNGEIKGAPADE